MTHSLDDNDNQDEMRLSPWMNQHASGVVAIEIVIANCVPLCGHIWININHHYQDEMRLSPRLNQHASGVVLGVTQIINGLYNPVQP